MSYFDDNEDYITGLKLPKYIKFQQQKEYKKLNITILNVIKGTGTDKNGKPFPNLEVAFKNNTFGGKVEGRKVAGYAKVAYDVLSVAQPGDSFEVTVEKKGQYNEWVQLQKAGAVVSVAQAAGAGNQTSAASSGFVGGNKPAGNTYGKDFETKEERAKKQVYIVRQSSVSNAVAILCAGSKSAPKVSEVIALARELEAYVFEQPSLGGNTGFDDVPALDPSFQTEPQI